MNELIVISEKQTVLGRDLHKFLEVESNYTTWFERMCEYGFEEGKDFVNFFPKMESGLNGGQNKLDHQITINMAKEISMIQRTEKGKQARKYFIECEQKLKSQTQPSYQIEDPIERAKAWIKEQEKTKLLEQQNTTLKKKEVAYTHLLDYSKHYSMSDVAKFFAFGRNKLMELLRSLGHLTTTNTPSQYCINQDYMSLKNVYVKQLKCYKPTTFITSNGLDFIARQLYKYKYIQEIPLPEDLEEFKQQAVKIFI